MKLVKIGNRFVNFDRVNEVGLDGDARVLLVFDANNISVISGATEAAALRQWLGQRADDVLAEHEQRRRLGERE